MTCKALNYVIKQLVNPTKKELKGLLQEVSTTLGTYHMKKEVAEEKVIIFAFSGHGTSVGTADKLYANDAQKLDLKEEIIKPFTMHKGVLHIPKLFLVDACRGTLHLNGVGGGGGDEVVEKRDEEGYLEKGVEHVLGNYRIDYATIPHHVSYAASDKGSMWMPKLAHALRTQNDSYQNIAADVKREVQSEKQRQRQMCESVSRLIVGTLYLQERLQHPAGGNNSTLAGEIGKKHGGTTTIVVVTTVYHVHYCLPNQHVYTQPFYIVILSFLVLYFQSLEHKASNLTKEMFQELYNMKHD